MTVRTLTLWILATALAWLLAFVWVMRALGEAVGA